MNAVACEDGAPGDDNCTLSIGNYITTEYTLLGSEEAQVVMPAHLTYGASVSVILSHLHVDLAAEVAEPPMLITVAN